MATVNKWGTPGTTTILLDSQINATASSLTVLSGVGAEYDNTVGGANNYVYGDIQLELLSDVTCGTGSPFVGVYLVPALNGTDYPNPPTGTGVVPSTYFVGNITANASAVFRRGALQKVVLPNWKFKAVIMNFLGVAFPTTALNTVKLYPYNEQSV